VSFKPTAAGRRRLNAALDAMFQLLRKLLGSSEAMSALRSYASESEWLQAWVGFRLQELRNERPSQEIRLGGVAAVPVFGSIGLDSAMDSSGKFWIAQYEVHEEEARPWREASQSERTWIIVCASKKRFPELAALLPTRPRGAIDCEACRGTGFVYNNVVICEACSALGWIHAKGT
jgi:hypothetical protein